MWVRDPHPIPGLSGPVNAAAILLDASTFGYFASVGAARPTTVLDSAAGITTAGKLLLTLRATAAGCQAGEVGTYDAAPSASGLTLTFQTINDACAARSAAFDGTWARAKCPSAPQWCLGEMDPGPHVSINYEPFVRQPDWQFNYGRFAFTVPTGWLTQEDNADAYALAQVNGADGASLFVFSDVLAHPPDSACPATTAKRVGTSADAIYGWIRSLPGIRATNVAENAVVGGLHGYTLDVAVDPAWTGGCPSATADRSIPLFVNAQSTPEEGLDWGLAPETRMRLFVLELGPDRTLAIDIEAQDKATLDALVVEAMPIVTSFEFKH
jgi:hypothetical protein